MKLNPSQAFKDPCKIFGSTALGAFELTLSDLVTFLKFNLKLGAFSNFKTFQNWQL